MAWTNPVTWVDGQLVAATDLNAQIRDNMNYLLTPNATLRSSATGTLTTTATTYASFGTAWALNINSYGGHLLAGAQMYSTLTIVGGLGDTTAFVAIDVDGTPYQVAALRGGDIRELAGTRLITGIASGAHVVTLKWRVTGGNCTATIYPHVQELNFWVMEV